MKTTITNTTWDFLRDIKQHNNREWFLAHKSKYESAKAEFEVFVDRLISNIAEFDPGIAHLRAKDRIFRIYRDARFSKDKSPYKTNFGAHLTAATKRSEIHSRAGYYIHLEPGGNSMIAGGAHRPLGDWLQSIRESIAEDHKAFERILKSGSFKTYLEIEGGDKLKRPPRGFDPDHPAVELLKHKSYLAVHKLEDKEVLDADFLKHASKVAKALKPFDDFLNQKVV